MVAAGCDCAGGNDLKNVSPKLTVLSEALDFGDVAVNDLRILGLTIKNEGQLPCTSPSSTSPRPKESSWSINGRWSWRRASPSSSS